MSNANTNSHDKEMVPRILVQAMFALMLATLALVAWARLTDHPKVGVLTISPVAAETTVHLTGSREGQAMVQTLSGDVLARSSDDKMGFVGVIWRVLARERALQGLPDTAPVRIVRRENGHIAVLDTASNWSVELIGYGKDNVAAFARLVD
ncbi:MAG: photosynthetic complex assembly protein PuhC [Sedimentitalea sp.]